MNLLLRQTVLNQGTDGGLVILDMVLMLGRLLCPFTR